MHTLPTLLTVPARAAMLSAVWPKNPAHGPVHEDLSSCSQERHAGTTTRICNLCAGVASQPGMYRLGEGRRMDSRHFDALVRALSVAGSRRRVLAMLATVPVAGELFVREALEDAEGKGRRRRRLKRHKHGGARRRKHKHKKPPRPTCPADSVAQSCADVCGSVTNNCGQTVDCGSCVCDPACPTCQSCNAATGQCVPDPAQQGDACGKTGQVCLADGTCACTETSCPVCRSCHRSGECTNPCASVGYCDGSTCQPGNTNAACGDGGVTCEVCTGQDVCIEGVCTCPATSCEAQGKNCGEISDECGGTLDCGTCSDPAPLCIGNVCAPCNAETCGHGRICDEHGCSCPPVTPSSECSRQCRAGTTLTTVEGCQICMADTPSCLQPERYPPCHSSADCAANAACISTYAGCSPGAPGMCILLCQAD